MPDCLSVDLHVHTLLSPCAEEEMTPQNIVRYAELCGLDILAIADHNSMGNVASVMEAAGGCEVTVLPGIEVQTREEVHLLGVFPDIDSGRHFSELVYETLPEADPSSADAFGEQVLVDARDRVTGYEVRALMFSASLDLETAVRGIHEYGGLAIAAHVDRRMYGLIGQLGFVPPGLALDALEVSRFFVKEGRQIADLPGVEGETTLLVSSDAHCLADMGLVFSEFDAQEASFAELQKALRREHGREVRMNMMC